MTMQNINHSNFLKEEFDITKFNLQLFTKDEITFLKKYGHFMEALTLGEFKPFTDDQRRFFDFFDFRYITIGSLPPIKHSPFTLQMKVWEKVLLSDEYFHRIKDDAKKLETRNYYVSVYVDFFSIIHAVKQLEVYLKVDGRTKVGDDDTVYVKYDYRFKETINDKYFNSLMKHSQIGQTVYTEKAYASYMNMGREFLDSTEGILLQIECKKIEVEMKISAISNYSKEEHILSLHLDGYDFKLKYHRSS